MLWRGLEGSLQVPEGIYYILSGIQGDTGTARENRAGCQSGQKGL